MSQVLNKHTSVSVRGVTVVICCYNSARRLPETLAHLAAQQVPACLPWEVIVVDNASTDGTAAVAAMCWPATLSMPLRVATEPRAGLTYARERGFKEAHFEYVSFIDDDNWVCPQWVETVYELMSNHPEIGVCGSVNEAVCEIPPPGWFENFKGVLAITTDDDPIGDLSQTGKVVLGAGMTVRRQAWRELLAKGFSQLVMDRQGKALTAGGDSEICLALRLAGWRIWRDPRLRLKHFLPAARLDWAYVRRLYRGYGESSVNLDGYFFLGSELDLSWKRQMRRTWQWHFLAAAGFLARRPIKLLLALCSPLEGDDQIPALEIQIGRLRGYWRKRADYARSREHVRFSFGSPPD